MQLGCRARHGVWVAGAWECERVEERGRGRRNLVFDPSLQQLRLKLIHLGLQLLLLLVVQRRRPGRRRPCSLRPLVPMRADEARDRALAVL